MRGTRLRAAGLTPDRPDSGSRRHGAPDALWRAGEGAAACTGPGGNGSLTVGWRDGLSPRMPQFTRQKPVSDFGWGPAGSGVEEGRRRFGGVASLDAESAWRRYRKGEVRPGKGRRCFGQSDDSGRTVFKRGAERAKLPVRRGIAALIPWHGRYDHAGRRTGPGLAERTAWSGRLGYCPGYGGSEWSYTPPGVRRRFGPGDRYGGQGRWRSGTQPWKCPRS